jgi:glycosyltransferase involved in cell wall biosynthesis
MMAERIESGFDGPPQLDVTIVLPVFNEAGHLREEIDRIRAAMDASPYRYEILVVDDGSTDGSGEILRDTDGIRLLQFTTNRGSGSCRKYGTLAARGRVVVWTDVDMTYPNHEIPALVAELDGSDQVVGARKSEEGTVKLLRRPAKWFIRKLASYLTGVAIPDLNSGFRAFRRDVGRQFVYLLPAGFSCVTTLTMTFLSNGYSIKYIPIDYAARAGESKFHWWKDTRRYLLQVVRLVLSYQPLKAFMPPAATLLAAGGIKLVYDMFDKHFRVGTNTVVILGFGLALAVLGMLSDLLVHVTRDRVELIPAVAAARATAPELGDDG